uniref:Uncharacterized protein n=1 Tax=Solanum lycopersicum TaxID=4081 RepID=A0A3Q7F722_SOLLC
MRSATYLDPEQELQTKFKLQDHLSAPVRTNMKIGGLTDAVVTSIIITTGICEEIPVESVDLTAYEYVERFHVLVSLSSLDEDQLVQDLHVHQVCGAIGIEICNGKVDGNGSSEVEPSFERSPEAAPSFIKDHLKLYALVGQLLDCTELGQALELPCEATR